MAYDMIMPIHVGCCLCSVKKFRWCQHKGLKASCLLFLPDIHVSLAMMESETPNNDE